MEEKELWKKLDEYPNIEISNLGRIKKLKNHKKHKDIIQSDFFKDKDGYSRINVLNKKGEIKQVGIHRLVALAFIPNLENKKCVNHRNSVRTDNRVSNLEWVTPKENVYHSFIFGNAVKRTLVPKNKVLTAFQISEIENLRRMYTLKKISYLFNINYSTLKNIIRKKKQHTTLDNQQPSIYSYNDIIDKGSTTIPKGSSE